MDDLEKGISEERWTLEQVRAIRLSKKIGRSLLNSPLEEAIVEDYKGGMTQLQIAKRYIPDAHEKSKLVVQKAISYIIQNTSLLTNEERKELESQHRHDSGIKLRDSGSGIHGMSREEQIETGKMGGKRSHELGLGVHARTREEMSEHGKKGGKISGKKLYELGLGIHALSREEKSKFGKVGGKIGGRTSYERKVGIHGMSREEKRKIGKKGYDLGLGIHALTGEERILYGGTGGKKSHELGLGVHARTREEMSEHGKKGGKRAYELGVGMFSLSKEEKRRNTRLGGKKATISKGLVPWYEEEGDLPEIAYAHNLSLHNEYRRGSLINCRKITRRLNEVYHKGKEVRSPLSVSHSLIKFRKSI